MSIHFSSNSGKINWAISIERGETKNSTFLKSKSKFLNGRSIYTFNSNPEINNFLYLTIFHDKNARSETITNYVFKNINSINLANFNDYKLTDSSIKIDISESNNNKRKL